MNGSVLDLLPTGNGRSQGKPETRNGLILMGEGGYGA